MILFVIFLLPKLKSSTDVANSGGSRGTRSPGSDSAKGGGGADCSGMVHKGALT